MKKLIVLINLIFFAAMSIAGNIYIFGESAQVDTLKYKSVGPGTMYAHLRFPLFPAEVHVLTVDLQNKYNSIETFLANDSIAGTELVSKACERNSYTGHEVFGGINADFFNVSAHNEFPLGAPRGGSIRNGVVQREPRDSWWGFACIDANKLPVLDYMDFSGLVKISEAKSFVFRHVNIPKDDCDLTFFNQYAGKYTRPYENSGGFEDFDRTEVFIRPIAGLSWSVNKLVKCRVERIVQNKGRNKILEGESVLSGIRLAKDFLDQLSVGQEIDVEMAVRTVSNVYPDLKQMVGGNAVLMKDGILTDRNESDSYNNVVYPRTGVASSADGRWLYLLVVDGKQGVFSNGINTRTMCGIFKAMGATNVVGLDGGGSSEMIVNHKVANRPADGVERSVGNGWLVVANAPDDNLIARIEFEDYKFEVPIFASLRPKVLGYNKYGLLINQDVTEFSLQCSSEIGSIDHSGSFIAKSTAQNGVLTANYNGITVSKPIKVVDAVLSICRDSVLIDHRINYPVQIQSVFGTNSMLVSPAAFNWTVNDPAICSIDKGIVSGLSNGSTMVFATLGDFKDSIRVNVEIPASARIVGNAFSPSDWTLSASSTLGAVLNTDNLPANWQHGAAVNYIFKTTRAPFVKLIKRFPLYSLPDTLKVVVNLGSASVSKAFLSLKVNNVAQDVVKEFTNVAQNVDTELTVALTDLFNTSDVAAFPIWFNYLNFYLGVHTVNQAYTLALKEVALCYKNMTLSVHNPRFLSQLVVFPNPLNSNQSVLSLKNKAFQQIEIQLYNLTGELIYSENIGPQMVGDVKLPIPDLAAGSYLLKITQNDKSETIKIIKN